MAVESRARPKKLPPRLRAIGVRAKEARERSGLTQTALAEKLGISPNQVSRLEAGQRLLQLETMLLLCDALGAAVGYVMNDEGELASVEFVETDRRKLRPHESENE